MTCYQRHMKWLFDELDLPYDEPSRQRVDHAIRDALEIPDDAHCPDVWEKIKGLSGDRLAELPLAVSEHLKT